MQKLNNVSAKRLTGRTTRMMAAVKAALTVHANVVVIMKDERHAKMWRERIGDLQGLSIEPMKYPPTVEIDWLKVELLGSRHKHKLFVDHEVFEAYFKEFVEAWTEFDAPVILTPERHVMLVQSAYEIPREFVSDIPELYSPKAA